MMFVDISSDLNFACSTSSSLPRRESFPQRSQRLRDMPIKIVPSAAGPAGVLADGQHGRGLYVLQAAVNADRIGPSSRGRTK